MDYATFVQQGEREWEAADELLGRLRRSGPKALDHGELERMASLHRRVVTDLAFARTHFPGTVTVRRLSALAFTGHRLQIRVERPFLARLAYFFSRGYPQLFRRSLPEVGVALAIFVGFVLLGGVITLERSEFAGLFLSQGTIEDLRHGDLWTRKVATVMPGPVLSSRIATNNVSVALFAWGGGALLGLGTIYLLALNGVMLGSMLALTWQYGLVADLGAFISAHGPLELTLVVVASAAGLGLARGTIAPGDLPRAVAFAAGARRSLNLVVGTVPWFALAALTEGYVSPAPWIPGGVKVAAGIALWLSFALWVFSGAGSEKAAEEQRGTLR